MAFSNYTGNLVGGTLKKNSRLTSQSSSQESITFSGSTLIAELYMETTDVYSALGLRGSSAAMIPSAGHDYETYSWLKYDGTVSNSYEFKNKKSGGKIYVSSNTESKPRRVFVLHSKNSIGNIYPAHLFYGKKSSNVLSSSSYAYLGYTSGNMNSWITHTDGSGVIYKSITVNNNKQFIETSILVERGYDYTFNMHTVSEASFDGIIISESELSSTASVSSGGFTRCSGADVRQSYTYSPSNNIIYIYFKTDSSNLGSGKIDTNGNKTYEGFTTGDIEIIKTPIKTKVTLNLGGATTGTSNIVISYGANMNTISVTIPTDKSNCRFAGYYSGNSSSSPGTMYIDSSGKGVSGQTWDIPEKTYTLYALYDYTPDIISGWYPLHCAYCTSNPTSISTLQTNISIILFGESIQLNIPGTLDYAPYSPIDSDPSTHLALRLSNEKTATIPAGTTSGDYIFNVRYTFQPNDSRVFTKIELKECKIWIIPTYIADETMVLDSIPTNLEQKKDIPVNDFTLNKDNLSEYFQYPITIPSTTNIIFNNGKNASSVPQITWSISQPITFISLGKTITSRQQVSIPDNSSIHMYVVNRRIKYSKYYSGAFTKVRNIILNKFGLNIKYYSQFSDLGISSFNIVGELETEFGITIDVLGLKDIYSVDLLCKYLKVFHNSGAVASESLTKEKIIDAIYGDQTDDKVYREANTVTSLNVSVVESSIYAGDKTLIKTKALLKSGSDVSVRGTYSGYDSSVININNAIVICVDNIPNLDDYVLDFSKIYYYYGQYNGNFLFKRMWEYISPGPGFEPPEEYIVTDSNDFDVLLHASYNYNGQFTTPTHIVGRLNEDMTNYNAPIEEVRILDVY